MFAIKVFIIVKLIMVILIVKVLNLFKHHFKWVIIILNLTLKFYFINLKLFISHLYFYKMLPSNLIHR